MRKYRIHNAEITTSGARAKINRHFYRLLRNDTMCNHKQTKRELN